MNQTERRKILIRALLDEEPRYRGAEVPGDDAEQRQLLRSLMNVRLPKKIGGEFLRVQDEYLTGEAESRGIVDIAALTPLQPELYLWRGDITRLRCGAIVNAANAGMTGCYLPCHNCIDNPIPFTITQASINSIKVAA